MIDFLLVTFVASGKNRPVKKIEVKSDNILLFTLVASGKI